jgi:hypothetical protein
VSEDLERIDDLFPERALVTADAERAFRDIERFISKEIEEGEIA